MSFADGKREKIAETLKYIEERLNELEAEKTEYQAYLKLDKKRRALEYTIYDKKLKQTLQNLQEIETERSREADRANEIHSTAIQTHKALRKAEKDIKALLNEIAQINKETSSTEMERQDLAKEQARIKLKVDDAENVIKRENANREKLTKELAELEAEIRRSMDELGKIRPNFDDLVNREKKLQEKLAASERRVNELYAKQGRSAQFKTKKDRDAFLKGEIKTIEDQLKDKKQQIDALSKEIQAERNQIKKLKAQIDSSSAELERKKTLIEDRIKQHTDLKNQRDDKSNQRK